MIKTLWNDKWRFLKTPLDVSYEDVFGCAGKKWEPLWQAVDLPHDWLIYDTLNLYEDSIGWYRKEFVQEAVRGVGEINMTHVSECGGEVQHKAGRDVGDFRTILRFDGVYMDSTLYVNGTKVGDWKYGYSAFEWDITDYLTEEVNEIVMRVVHQAPNSRWYSGAGIYRNVWQAELPKVHIPFDGIYVSTMEKENGYELLVDAEISWDQAELQGKDTYKLIYILSDEGRRILREEKTLTWGQEKVSDAFFVENPKLWDMEEPNLYGLQVFLIKTVTSTAQSNSVAEQPQQILLQQEGIKIGFRTIRFLPEQGFLLNGRKVRLNGACDHHDLGALGAAFSKTAMRRKFLKMRQMGVNALRTSHNMPAAEVMELADEMGFLVLSEAFDMWEIAKNPYDYARFFTDWAQRDVRSWIRRDRNHPSLIMWSIGNEISDTHVSEHGQEITRRLMQYVRKWDYRCNAPITIGSNYMPWENARKCADIVKLAGYNYAEKYYEEHHKEHPDWIIYGSETGSVLQSRGVYHFPLECATLIEEDEQCSALGNSTASWAAKNAEYCISMDREADYSCGQFIWTAFDYIGEPTPYQTKNSYFGQMDTAGFPKDSFYLYQAEWTDYKKTPMVHVYPYWDFNKGQKIDVRICSNAPQVELFVNGRSMGKRQIDHRQGTQLQPTFQTVYEPGYIEAVAYDENGKEIARQQRHSFGDSYKVIAKADKEILYADGEDLIFVEISAEDKDGYPVENASDYVKVTVKGAARLLGLDNGDSTDFDQYKGTVRKLFNGKLLAIVASKAYQTGDIEVVVEGAATGIHAVFEEIPETIKGSEGLIPAVLKLQAVSAPVRPGISANTENQELSLAFVEQDFVPVRKIELSALEGQVLSPECPKVMVKATLYPENASDRNLIWKVVDMAGMESRAAKIELLENENDTCQDNACGHSICVRGVSDGNFLVRCQSKNGTDKVKLISQLDMKVEGMGTAFATPYEPVSGMAYSDSIGDVGRGPANSAYTDKTLETGLIYKNLEFGDYGSDEISLSIFANDSDAHRLQIWQGAWGEKDCELLGDVIYQKPGEWEVFQTETYRLKKRLCGIQTITIVAHDKLFLKEFYFTRLKKAFETLWVAETAVIYGDKFEKREFEPNKFCVEQIGNNVSLVCGGMDFGERGARQIVICGHTPLQSNTIQLRFDGAQESIQVLEFPGSEDYVELTFDLNPVFGETQVTFVFLPGCHFDFKWFRFL